MNFKKSIFLYAKIKYASITESILLPTSKYLACLLEVGSQPNFPFRDFYIYNKSKRFSSELIF